jgi:anti-anti-sigma factor
MPAVSSPALQEIKIGSALVVRYSGDPDSDLNNLTAGFIRKRASRGERLIVLDMERVRDFASAAINSLIRILHAVQEEGGVLALVNIPARVMKILSMMDMIGKFTVYDSIEELKSSQDQAAPVEEELINIAH